MFNPDSYYDMQEEKYRDAMSDYAWGLSNDFLKIINKVVKTPEAANEIAICIAYSILECGVCPQIFESQWDSYSFGEDNALAYLYCNERIDKNKCNKKRIENYHNEIERIFDDSRCNG